ncbi:MAG TPA: acyl-CoA thioesterase [Thermoanaerobaculia bacterium]|jgi:4-hydroxybenzoyl-CoA thioesterase|nr:acyl-CoA thioesterase [Thermoanaerobaculia bacterium]
MPESPTSSARRFVVRRLLRFADCDPAGIAFYPRLCGLINDLVEDWFRDGLDYGFPLLHDELKRGIPIVRLAVDFTAPGRMGEEIAWSLGVREIGKSSVSLEVRAEPPAGKPMLVAEARLVHCDMASGTPVPLAFPDEVRARMAGFLTS